MGQGSPMANRLLRVSLDLAIVLLALLTLLPAKKLITFEANCLDNQIQAALDKADSDTLVRHTDDPPVSKEAIYLTPDTTTCFLDSPVVLSHRYRGPPPFCPYSRNRACYRSLAFVPESRAESASENTQARELCLQGMRRIYGNTWTDKSRGR